MNHKILFLVTFLALHNGDTLRASTITSPTEQKIVHYSVSSWGRNFSFNFYRQSLASKALETPLLFIDWKNDKNTAIWNRWTGNGNEETSEEETIFSLVTKRPIITCRLTKGNKMSLKEAMDALQFQMYVQKCFVARIARNGKIIIASFDQQNEGPTRVVETHLHIDNPTWINELENELERIEDPTIEPNVASQETLWDSFHSIDSSEIETVWEAYV